MQLVFGNWFFCQTRWVFPRTNHTKMSISWLTPCLAEWNHELRQAPNTGSWIPPRMIFMSLPRISHKINGWLVVSNMTFIFHFIYGMSSFPLTFIFFRGVAQPPTRIILFISFYVLFLLVSLFLLQMSDFLCSFCPDLVREFSVSSVAVAWKGLTANQPVFHRTLVFQPWHVAFEIPKKYLGWLLKNLGIIINRKPFSTN